MPSIHHLAADCGFDQGLLYNRRYNRNSRYFQSASSNNCVKIMNDIRPLLLPAIITALPTIGLFTIAIMRHMWDKKSKVIQEIKQHDVHMRQWEQLIESVQFINERNIATASRMRQKGVYDASTDRIHLESARLYSYPFEILIAQNCLNHFIAKECAALQIKIQGLNMHIGNAKSIVEPVLPTMEDARDITPLSPREKLLNRGKYLLPFKSINAVVLDYYESLYEHLQLFLGACFCMKIYIEAINNFSRQYCEEHSISKLENARLHVLRKYKDALDLFKTPETLLDPITLAEKYRVFNESAELLNQGQGQIKPID